MQIVRHLNHDLEYVISIIDLTPEEAKWAFEEWLATDDPDFDRYMRFKSQWSEGLAAVL